MSTSLTGGMGMRGPTGSSSGLQGTGYKQVQTQNFTPEQMNLFSQMFKNVQPDSFTSRLASGDASQFGQLETPALKQFAQLQGGIASRFSGQAGGQGPLSSRRSSGFQNTTNQAAADFAQQLQSQRMDIQRQALGDLFNMSNILLKQQPYQNRIMKENPKKSFWESLLGGGIPLAGAALGGAFGGIPGAQLGGTLGNYAGQAFA